jgi:hypothetical protein
MFVGKHKVCLGNIGCFSPLDSILKKIKLQYSFSYEAPPNRDHP